MEPSKVLQVPSERQSGRPRDDKGPNALRPVKLPRRIIAALDALKSAVWEPRWAVIERLLPSGKPIGEPEPQEPDTTAREGQGE